MSTQHPREASPDLAEQALCRTTAPAAHRHGPDGYDEHRDHEHHDDHEHAFEWQEMLRIAFVAVAAAAVWWRLWEPFPAISLIGLLGLAAGGWPIFGEAVENLLAKRMTMELSMSIAIIA